MAWNLEEANIFFVVIRKAVLRIGRFLRSRAVGAKGHGPPEFLQVSQPYQTRWADFDHHITTCPPGFLGLPKTLRSRSSHYRGVDSFLIPGGLAVMRGA